MAKALCPELESYILSENARLRIRPVGILPHTTKAGKVVRRMPVLSDCFQTDRGEWMMYVWAGASNRTIWSSPAVNVAFRAWHDYGHIQTGLGMDPDSETELAQRTTAEARVNGLSNESCRILMAETFGQIQHYLKHGGAFPVNQRAFVKAFAAGTWKGERF